MPGAPGLVRRLERMGHFAILSFGGMTKKWSKPMAWSDKFNHPIKGGARRIHTLHDAHLVILGLSGLQRMLPAWQGAIGCYRKRARWPVA